MSSCSPRALSLHREWVVVWYRYLNLLKTGLQESMPGDVRTPLIAREQLALGLIAASGGSAKLILDAGLAGYYAQAYAIVRHLFETWLRLEYVRLRPHEARRWFVSDRGEPPRPPSENTIHNYVRNSIEAPKRTAVAQVLATISRLNQMAHPSPVTLLQTVGADPRRIEVGANYVADLCTSVLHEGATALRYLLVALSELIPQPEEWRNELAAVAVSQTKLVNESKQS